MRVCVTLVRTLEQYADVIVPEVESVNAATDRVARQLTDPVARARLLRGVTWFGDSPIDIAVNTATEETS